MVLNSSNASHLVLPSSSLSICDFFLICFHSTVGILNITVYTIFSLLLLPIYALIFYLGHQRWQRQRSSTAMSHSDIITYHLVVIELVNTIGCILCCCSIYADVSELMIIGVYLFPFKLTGQMLFHILTCVERYLAVVHPVTYLGLKTANMIRIRNLTYGCVWVLCAISVACVTIVDELSLILMSCFIITSAVLFFSFFSISAVWTLIQSKPGEGVGNGHRVHQTKLRAFYTIISILGLLLLSLGSNGLSLFKSSSLQIGENIKCGLSLSVFWFSVPSTLVLPLMFLQKAGKLSCFKKKQKGKILARLQTKKG